MIHPNLNASQFSRIGVWEDDAGDIAAVAHYEDGPGHVYFQVRPDCIGFEKVFAWCPWTKRL